MNSSDKNRLTPLGIDLFFLKYVIYVQTNIYASKDDKKKVLFINHAKGETYTLYDINQIYQN